MSMFDIFSSDMRTPSVASGILHVGVVVLAIVGLPLFDRPPLPEPEPMIVDYEEIGPKAASPTVGAVKPTSKAPIAKEETPAPPPKTADKPPPTPDKPKPPEPPKPVQQQSQPTPAPVKAPEPEKPQPDPDLALAKPKEPEPPKVEPPKPAPTPTPTEVKKPEPPKPERAKPVQPPKPPQPQPQPTKSIDDIVNALVNKDQTAQPHKPVQETPKPAQPTRTATAAPNYAQRLTSSEMGAMADRVRPCWNINPDAMNARDLVVEIIVDMQPDGMVSTAKIGDGIRIAGPQHAAFAQAALRAVQNPRCQPLPYPQGKYEALRQFIFRFDPRDL